MRTVQARQTSSYQRLLLRWESLVLWMELVRNLATRDVEIRYKHSLLGLYWAILNPLITSAIFGFVFGVVLHANSKPIPYVVFLVAGLTFWNLFANAVVSATGSVTGNAALLAKVYFPRIILPTAAVFARIIDFGFSLIVFVLVDVVYRTPIHVTAIFVVPLLLLEVLFALGVGYIVAALNVLYRDMSQLIGLVLMVWMYFSPVMYALSSLSSAVQTPLLVNPMGAMLEAQRDLIFLGRLTEPAYLWISVMWTLFTFVAGLSLFKRVEPLFAEVL